MYQVSKPVSYVCALLTPLSNLTFGAGGKDKDGNNISGWGYYEVRTDIGYFRRVMLTAAPFRLSPVARALVHRGMEHLVFTRTSQIPALVTLNSLSAATLS